MDGAWVCTGYDDIKAVLHDTEQFSSLMPTGPSRLPDILADAMAKLSSDPSMAEIFAKTMDNRGQAAVLLNADPPDHRRQRLAVNTAFRPARLRGMEPLIESVASRMLDEVIAADRFEVVGDFAGVATVNGRQHGRLATKYCLVRCATVDACHGVVAEVGR